MGSQAACEARGVGSGEEAREYGQSGETPEDEPAEGPSIHGRGQREKMTFTIRQRTMKPIPR
ncbi:MAG: hypothetical protein DYH07_08450 [Armatimonadetes bacterium ATM1]|nr:hypothetical protein [Armatimonadota bacterium]MCE7900107.1 hypothetical protein [Armatimonadetes bacterium ATM1]RIJ95140.1 MAG: hypothetical protein DCC45_11095 [Armatimonadota bacterium]